MELVNRIRRQCESDAACLLRYALTGAASGLVFPILGTLVHAWTQGSPMSPSALIQVQRGTPLLWIVDLAPLVLGSAGLFLGLRQMKIVRLNAMLEEKVRERTRELEAAIRKMEREIQERLRVEEEVREACRIEMRRAQSRPEESTEREPELDAGREPSKLQGARVLLVDDNPINLKVAALMLRKLGCKVFLARHGLEAVELTRSDPFDLVLMDCHMPEMDGFAATQEIRRMPGANRRVPILALTASTQRSDQQLCFEAGMDDYIAKPVRSEMLAERLEHWIGRKTPVEV